jgi:acyl-CoA thioesterase-1
MNPVVVQLANGNAFFIGVEMTVLAFVLRFWVKRRYLVILLTVTWLIGISLVILSAAPLSYWLYALWFVLCIATRLVYNVKVSDRWRLATTASFVVFSILFCLDELPFHLAKTISVSKGQTVYVVGDSISAGIEEKEKTWPAVLGDLSQLKVINLARAGSTVDTAQYQLVGITSPDALIFVEIGGNDLLGNTDSHTFYVQLDSLLSKLRSKSTRIVMFELPLLPFWNAYGTGQRILARKYNVILIPKSYLVRAFAGKGNTIDGLHLSQKGHDELAKSVYDLLDVTQGRIGYFSGTRGANWRVSGS